MPTKPKPHNYHTRQAEQQKKDYEANPQRREDKAFYCSKQWRAFREYILRKRPVCECDQCKKDGRIMEAKHVHHVKPRKAHPELAFEEGNVLALSHPCHSRIEAERRGGSQ